jgi:hypothetical protein
LNISKDVDDLFFDGKRRRIYVSCGEGYIDVVEQVDSNQYRPLSKLATIPGARTALFSAELDLLALAAPKQGAQAAEVRLYQPR